MKMIKGIVCDMDGTLVDFPNEPFHSSWDALGELLDEEVKREWYWLRDFYYPKKERYLEWFNKQVALLKGLALERVEDALFPLPYSSGVREFFSDSKGYLKGILSSGISVVAEKIASELGFGFVRCAYLEIKDGIFSGRGSFDVKMWKKDEDLAAMACEMGLSLDEVLYVGDNENDIPAFEVAGISVAFRPKTNETKRYADYVINNFRELNEILKAEGC